jgi:hypothetical protein
MGAVKTSSSAAGTSVDGDAPGPGPGSGDRTFAGEREAIGDRRAGARHADVRGHVPRSAGRVRGSHPQDPRLPENVGVESDRRANARDGDRVAGEFTALAGRARADPACRVLRVFGTDTAEGPRETDVIVYDLGLPVEFTTEASARRRRRRRKPPGRRETSARRHDLRRARAPDVRPGERAGLRRRGARRAARRRAAGG